LRSIELADRLLRAPIVRILADETVRGDEAGYARPGGIGIGYVLRNCIGHQKA